jgi:hypothetical protein
VQTNRIETDRLQKVVARLVATSPAGVSLLLIGGFRYRLLNNSQRFSVDIDYHWEGNLEAKQRELLALCRRVILGQVRRELGYEGSVLQENRAYHATAIQKVVDEQMDSTVAQQVNAGGGGRAVLDSALNLILKVCPP